MKPTSELPPADARRDRLIAAAESTAGIDTLRDEVKGLLGEGTAKETLLEDLSQVRRLVDEEAEDRILDVMDLLVGWCAPDFRLGE